MGEIQKRKCPYCGNMTPVGGEYCAACNSFLGNDPTQKETAQYAQPKEEQSAQPVAQASYEEHDEFFSSPKRLALPAADKSTPTQPIAPSVGIWRIGTLPNRLNLRNRRPRRLATSLGKPLPCWGSFSPSSNPSSPSSFVSSRASTISPQTGAAWLRQGSSSRSFPLRSYF